MQTVPDLYVQNNGYEFAKALVEGRQLLFKYYII